MRATAALQKQHNASNLRSVAIVDDIAGRFRAFCVDNTSDDGSATNRADLALVCRVRSMVESLLVCVDATRAGLTSMSRVWTVN